MKLLIVRHGECQANVDGIVAGSQNDSPLTDKGMNDAKNVAEKIKGTHIDAILATPLQRSKRSAEIIRNLVAPQIQVESDADFIELDVGEATGLPLAEYFAKEKADEPIPGAESPEDALVRVKRGLKSLKHRSGTVLLVTHNGTYRLIMCAIERKPASEFAFVPGLHNGEIKEVIL